MELNATEVSGGTGIIEIDLVLLMMQAVIAIVISVGGGTFLGYRLSERSRNNQEKNEIQKVKDLLKIDFERLNGLSITYIEKMLEFIEQTQDDDFIDGMMTSVTNVIVYQVEYIKFYNFVYWSVLSDSGHLIKLNKDEISIVYDAHFKITGATSKIEEWNKKYLDYLQPIVKNTTLPNRKERFKPILKTSTYGILVQYEFVYHTIQNMDISWLDIKELSSEHKEKLNSTLAEYEREFYE